MRSELQGLLDELAPRPDPQLTIDGTTPVVKLSIHERAKRWDLAIRLGRELGTEVDPGEPVGQEPVPARGARRGKVDFG